MKLRMGLFIFVFALVSGNRAGATDIYNFMKTMFNIEIDENTPKSTIDKICQHLTVLFHAGKYPNDTEAIAQFSDTAQLCQVLKNGGVSSQPLILQSANWGLLEAEARQEREERDEVDEQEVKALLQLGAPQARLFLTPPSTEFARAGDRTYDMSGASFDSIIFAGCGKVHVKAGDEYSVKVVGDNQDVEALKVFPMEQVLFIVNDDSAGTNVDADTVVMEQREAEIYITLPHLKNFKVKGNALATITGFKEDMLSVNASGFSGVQIDDLEVGELYLRSKDLAHVQIAAALADLLVINASGKSMINAAGLTAVESEVVVRGRASVEVYVKDFLEATVKNSGELFYGGNPHMVEKQLVGKQAKMWRLSYHH